MIDTFQRSKGRIFEQKWTHLKEHLTVRKYHLNTNTSTKITVPRHSWLQFVYFHNLLKISRTTNVQLNSNRSSEK